MRRNSVLVLTLSWLPLIAIASPARSSANPKALGTVSRFPVRCEGGQAITRTPNENLPLVVGVCDGNGQLAGERALPAPAPPGPADCLVPGLDDRCEAWTAPRYDGPFGSADYPGYGSVDRHRTVVAHPTEDLVFIGGTSQRGTGPSVDADFVNIAYRASTGAPVWTQTYEGPGERTLAYESSLALSPDGDTLYALGEAAEPGVYDYDSLIVAFEATTGQRLAVHTVPLSAKAIETAMTTLPDGTVAERIYAAGTTGATLPDGTTVPAGAVAAIDPTTGDALWTSRFVGETPDGSRFNELVVAPDGATVYAGGGEHLPSRLCLNFLTVAFGATDGTKQWEARDTRTQPTTGNNGISDMQIAPDGSRVLITGLDSFSSGSILGGSSSAILTVAHDPQSGAVAWRKSYGGPVEGETHFYFTMFQGMLGISPDGRTAVATAAINSNSATGTVAYDVATGAQKWGVESSDAMHAYSFTNYIGYYPTVAVGNARAFVSNRRGFGYSQVLTVTTAYSLGGGALDWTARLGTNRTLFGGNGLSADGKKLFVTTADQLYSAGFPAPDPGLDTVDILTVAYDA